MKRYSSFIFSTLSLFACIAMLACSGSSTTSTDTTTQTDATTQADTATQNDTIADVDPSDSSGDTTGDATESTKVSLFIEASKGGVLELPGIAKVIFPPNSIDGDTTATLELLSASQAGGKGSLRSLSLKFKPKRNPTLLGPFLQLDAPVSTFKLTNPGGVFVPATVVWESDSVGRSVASPPGSIAPLVVVDSTGEVKHLESRLPSEGTISLYNTHARVKLTKDGAYGGEVTIENSYDRDLVIAFRSGKSGPYFKTTIKPGETKPVGPTPAGNCDSGSDTESVEFEILGSFDMTGKTATPLGDLLLDGSNAYLNVPKTRSAGLGAKVKYTRKCTKLTKGDVDLRKAEFEANPIYLQDYVGDVMLGKLKLYDTDGVAIGAGTLTASPTFKTYDARGVELPADNTKVLANEDGTFTLSLTKWGFAYSRLNSIRVTLPDGLGSLTLPAKPKHPEILTVEEYNDQNKQVASISINNDTPGQILIERTDITDLNDTWKTDSILIEYSGTRVLLGPLDFVKIHDPGKAIGRQIGAYAPLTTLVYDAALLKVTKRTWTRFTKDGSSTVETHTMTYDGNDQATWAPDSGQSKTVIFWPSGEPFVAISRIEVHEKKPNDGPLELKFKTEYTYKASWVSNDFLYSYKLSQPAGNSPTAQPPVTVELTYTFGEIPEEYKSDGPTLSPGFEVSFDDANAWTLKGPEETIELITNDHGVVVDRNLYAKLGLPKKGYSTFRTVKAPPYP